MKTTVDISSPLLLEAKTLAQRKNTSLKALVEEGLRHVIRTHGTQQPFKLRDGSVGGSGLTAEFEARGGMAKLREAAYPGFFDNDEDETE